MSRFATQGYTVGRPTRVCAATGAVLAPGDMYVAALVEPGDGKWQRVDFALAAWQAGSRPASMTGALVGSWRAVVPAAGDRGRQRGRLAMDDESMLDLLTQLEPGDAKRDAVRLVLALLLVQRRALTQQGARAGVMLLRPRGAGPDAVLIEVKDLGVDEGLVAEALNELEDLAMGGGEDAAGGEPPAAQGPAA